MRKNLFVSVICVGLGVACSNLFTTGTAPTATPTQLSTGQWASIASTTSATNTCTDFHWNITEVSGSSGSGTFTARCLGTMQVSGTAQGTIAGDTVNWTATGVGTTLDTPSCAVSLTGTATFDGTQFRIPFTGTTCQGPVSGAEVLRRG